MSESSTHMSSLVRLSEGNLAGWAGIDSTWTKEDVAYVLPLDTDGDPHQPDNGPVDYAKTDGAPNGLTVHYDSARVSYVTIYGPRLVQTILDALGEPEMVLRSGLEGAHEQWAYPGRGITAHMDVSANVVVWLYAYPSMPTENYPDSTLARARTLRHRVRGEN